MYIYIYVYTLIVVFSAQVRDNNAPIQILYVTFDNSEAEMVRFLKYAHAHTLTHTNTHTHTHTHTHTLTHTHLSIYLFIYLSIYIYIDIYISIYLSIRMHRFAPTGLSLRLCCAGT